ncbi:MAG: cation diffusion facilitator family transporter [Gammaproteobacteria bacterium]|nr:cation diffusion facilitator family transporter [Gammaproteobacteria bacterium]MDX2487337.1 cation diffusion facilitator family transporter [Gammaproteobacteria bacterium]
MSSEPAEERKAASKRATFASIFVNILLSIGQIVLGVIGNSQALIADGVHTLSDLSTDTLVLYAIWHGSKEADDDHPYGHGRIETAATVFLGLLLAIVGAGIAINAALRLTAPEEILTPAPITLLMAVITILSKEGLYRYTISIANRVHSNILRANAWHHRSDAISSVIVLIGIGGSIMGLPYFDSLAAIGLGSMIIRMGLLLSWKAMKELIDTALGQEEVEAIGKTIGNIDGVIDLHMLRTRLMGGRALVDVHLQVDGDISVSEGHQISENVRASVINEFESVNDVLVHIDPEDDEISRVNIDLPLRNEISNQLNQAITGIEGLQPAEKITLHYLSGKINIDLIFPTMPDTTDESRRAMAKTVVDTLQQNPNVGDIEIFFHCQYDKY